MDEHTYDEATEAEMERDLRTLARDALPEGADSVQAIRDEAAAIPSHWRGLAAPTITPPRRRSSFVGGFVAGVGVLSLTFAAYAAHRTFGAPARPEPAAIAVLAPQGPARDHASPGHILPASEVEVVAPPEVTPDVTSLVLDTHAPTARPATRARARVVPSEPHHVAPAAPAAPAPSGTLDRTLEQLLDGALGERPAASASAALPLVPTQASVRTTMRALERRVDACREDSAGIAVARFAIEGSTGRVRQVNVSGVDADEAACIERIVAEARFEPFSQSELSVSFPYRVR